MATKLLLIKDVDDLGRSGDIVSVRPGYARNFLVPNCFAIPAEKRALHMQARLKEERLKQAIVDKQEADKQAAAIDGLVINTVVKVDHEGHMYGSVSVHDIIVLLEQQANVLLEKRCLNLKHAIKETGVHEIGVKLKEGVSATFTLKVVSDIAMLNADAEQPAT